MYKERHKRSRKRRKVPLYIGLVLLLIIFGGILFYRPLSLFVEKLSDKKAAYDSPEELMERYYAFLADGQYEKMYGLLDPDSQSSISRTDFVARNKNIYEGMEAEHIAIRVTGSNQSKYNRTVTVIYDVNMDTLAGEIAFSGQTEFLYLDNEEGPHYALSWDDSVIFPELTARDKVLVATEQAKRGSIFDRNGKLLAGEGLASSVGLVPGKMGTNRSGDLKKLSKILGVSKKSIQKKLKQEWVKDDSFVPVKTVEKLTDLEKISYEPTKEVIEKIERDEALLAISGVAIMDTQARLYPYKESTSHLVGYVQKLTSEELKERQSEGYDENSLVGKSGIESIYEKELKGRDGYKVKIVNSDGDTKSVLATAPKQDGKDVYLTIHANLQEKIYQTFSSDESCTLAMNPYTGEVLALVSTPSFDSNDFIYGMSGKLWDSLNKDAKMPLYNRFRQRMCPGSSLKPIVAAVALKAGVLDADRDYGNEGTRWQKDESWGSYYVTTLHACETANLENAIVYSDNIYFAKAALSIGGKKFKKGLKGLGFQKKLPFEISLAQSQYSNSGAIESEIQLADSGYGQGQVLVNPVHLAALYTGFLNGGDIIQPYLLYKEKPEPKVWIESAYPDSQAELIKNILVRVVESEHGTGHKAYREDITLAAKTGTAEIKRKKDDQVGTEVGWFSVFTADKKQKKPLLLLSMVEDVKDRGGSGYVVEKDVQVLDYWIPEKKADSKKDSKGSEEGKKPYITNE